MRLTKNLRVVIHMAEEQEIKSVTISINDLIYGQVKELGKRMDRLEVHLDKIETRMDKQDEKIEKLDAKIDRTRNELNGRIDKLSDKIDAMHNEIKSSTGHISIANISTVGIALAVIYSVLK